MTKMRTATLMCLMLMWGGGLLAQEEASRWEIKPLTESGWVEYDYALGIASATNGVYVSYGGAVLTADSVAVNMESGEVTAEGHVRIHRDDQIWTSESVRYNFKTRQLEARQFRTGKPPFFAFGHGLHGNVTNQLYSATNAFLTTDDVSEPVFKIRAKELSLLPGQRMVARHATLYAGSVPVFYWPYFTRNLGDRVNNFDFIPGYRSSWGPFLLGSYRWFLNEELDGTFHLDYRAYRGVGLGPDVNYNYGDWGRGSIRYYYMYDQDPNRNNAGGEIPFNRQRLWFSYQSEPATNLAIKAMVRWQGDTNIVKEFFEGEYRQNPQPSTFVDVNKFWSNFSLDTYVQPRVNDWLDTVERLPEARLTGFRQQIGQSPFYYESDSSFGYYRRLFPETNSYSGEFDYWAARADTFHQILLPYTFFGWLNVEPRVGGRFTEYTRASGPGGTTDEESRGVFNTGAEANFKASRLWPEVESKFLDLDGVRHIVQPMVSYSYAPTPNVLPLDLPQFDYPLPSLRLLPFEFPDNRNIDSIYGQNIFRFGMRNKLQTKRDGKVEDFLNWNLYTDCLLDRQPGTNAFYPGVYSDLMLRPRTWLIFESLLRYDTQDGNWAMSFNTLTLRPNDLWSWSIGHYYLANDPSTGPLSTGPGYNLITSAIFARFSEDWGFRMAHRYDIEAGRLQEQAYSVYRDLRNWTAALTFRLRQNASGPEDFSVAFTFSLKAFPRYPVGGDAVRPFSMWGG